MKHLIDRRAVADRICGLIGGQDDGIIERTARRLGVGEVSLRLSIDPIDPHPTLEVADAIVREYGVDPTWLMTGSYDSGSHRRAMEDERSNSQSSFSQLFGQRRVRETPVPRPEIKLEA